MGFVFLLALCVDPPEPVFVLSPNEIHLRWQQAKDDPIALLRLSTVADKQNAQRLRQDVHKLLQQQPADLREPVVQLLPQLRPSPRELEEVLGKPSQLTRQLLNRRYLEQWSYEQPLPLVVTFEYVLGQEPRLQHVRRTK